MRILYNSMDREKFYREARQKLKRERGYNSKVEIVDREVYDEVKHKLRLDWNEFVKKVNRYMVTVDILLIYGIEKEVISNKVGKWIQNKEKGYIVNSFIQMCYIWRGSKGVKIYETEDCLYIECETEIGINRYEIRVLSDKYIKDVVVLDIQDMYKQDKTLECKKYFTDDTKFKKPYFTKTLERES